MKIRKINEMIKEFVRKTPFNTVKELDGLVIYNSPLVGVACANDTLFDALKQDEAIGPHHLLPKEWMPDAVTVISYFLPFTETICTSNIKDEFPSTEWMYGRIEGEECNKSLKKYLKNELRKLGYKVIIPPEYSRYKVVEKRSNWSERHIAYIAGLGTFGLSKSLITEKGCAGRLGSLITNLKLDITPRSYNGLYEYCIGCGKCIKRCPADSINANGKEHGPCALYVKKMKAMFAPRYGCGKCQTAVPCENKIPRKNK